MNGLNLAWRADRSGSGDIVSSCHPSVRVTLRALLIGSLIGLGGNSFANVTSTLPPAANDAVAGHVDPAELVRAMSFAMKTLNYEGNFVHLQGPHITSMNILHSSNANGELERLRALDGEAREVFRNQTLVTCIWPDSQSVVVSKSRPRELLPQVSTDLANNKRYKFSLGHYDRVAGKETYVVNVTPTDSYRYGYRFWIDQETSMLLRSMLIEVPQRIVEQVMFTSIEYPEFIEASRFDVSMKREQLSWLEPKKAQATSGMPELRPEQVDRISFLSLPEGYREVSETLSPMPSNTTPVSHVMLTDGMASVSVYVEYLNNGEQSPSLKGLSSMGAMNAYGLSIETAFITVVGEVPADTVRAIANAVQIH